MSETFLRIGDEIFLYDDHNNLLVSENPLETRACARPPARHCLPSEALGTAIFKLEPQQTYKVQRELEHFNESISFYETDKSNLKLLEQRALKEIQQNEAEKRRLLGKPILYGQVIQLFNPHFKKYLTVSGKTCRMDVSHLQVNLATASSVGYFRIMPRYRIRVDGEPVRLGDTVALQCVRPDGYLNVDHEKPTIQLPFEHEAAYEVYSHTRISSWTMKLHSSTLTDQDTSRVKYTNSGQYVRFYHKEMESYLEAPVIHGNEVVLRKHVINPLEPKETDSPLAFWEIENVNVSRGSKIRWKKPVRIRHVASRAYLSIDPSNISVDVMTGKATYRLQLVKNPPCTASNHDDTTLFQLVPISAPLLSGIPFGSFIRFQHVLTKCWLHASHDDEDEQQVVPRMAEPSSLVSPQTPVPRMPQSSLFPTQSKSQSLGLPSINTSIISAPPPLPRHHIRYQSISTDFSLDEKTAIQALNGDEDDNAVSGVQDFYYHDCFLITQVDQDLIDTFNFANEVLPRLQQFLIKKREKSETCAFPIDGYEQESIVNILKELIYFCTESNEMDPTKRIGLPIEYHQMLLRDIGIIETVIHMIIAPFDMDRRHLVRQLLNTHQQSIFSHIDPSEPLVLLNELKRGDQGRLCSILTMCYHLIRVFLIGRSSFEEQSELAKENQGHVLKVASETGLSLFISHLPFGIGATNMMTRLLCSNGGDFMDSLFNFSSRAGIIDVMIDMALKKTTSIVDTMNENHRIKEGGRSFPKKRKSWNGDFIADQQGDESHDEKEYDSSSCFKLLSALCYTNQHQEQHHQPLHSPAPNKLKENATASVTQNRDYISEKLLDKDQCLLATRVSQNNQVEIKFRNDEWRSLYDVLYSQPAVAIYLESVLELVYSLSDGTTHTKTLGLTRRAVSKQVCLNCVEYVMLPCKIKAKFGDILRVLYLDINPFTDVILSDFTFDYASLKDSDEYPCGGIGEENKQPLLFEHLRLWIFRFLDMRHHEFVDSIHDVKLLSSVLNLIHTQLRLGFYNKAKDIENLFRALVHVLDGRTDARNEEHFKSLRKGDKLTAWDERFQLTESNQQVMNTKIQILNIFDLIFDLRLHVRMLKIAADWKATKSDSERGHVKLRKIFDETHLRDREESLMPILEDILKYDYAPLKQIAVIVMHRLYDDTEDILDRSNKVLMLSHPQQILVYRSIKKRLSLLQSYISTDAMSTDSQYDHLSSIRSIMHDFEDVLSGQYTFDYQNRLCVLEEKEGQDRIYASIFHNLDTHTLLIALLETLKDLSLEYGDAVIYTLKVCLDFLVNLIKVDKKLQKEFVLQYLDLFIEICSRSPKLAVSLCHLCANNLLIGKEIREKHITRILRISEGFYADFLLVLQEWMKAQGKVVRRNQDSVMRFLMNNRSTYIPFDRVDDLKLSTRLDYCVQLIGMVAVCAQGENRFGQSFARTIFSIKDIYQVVQDPDTSLALKTVMLKFLASVYLEDIEFPSNFSHDDNDRLFKLLELSYREMVLFEKQSSPESERYIYRGIVPFLRSIFEHHVSVDTTMQGSLFDLCPRIVEITLALLPGALPQQDYLQNMLSCLDSMLNVAGFKPAQVEPQVLLSTIKDALFVLDQHYGIGNAAMIPFDEINEEFQVYFEKTFMGDDVKKLQQEEFEKLCSHFNLQENNTDELNDDGVASLISYLSGMTATQVDPRNEHYQIATVEILQEIPARYIRQRKLDYDESLEMKKVQAQNRLNELGCTLVAQNLLSSPRKKIFDAALRLIISLLEGGNKQIQDKLEAYFYSIREERFFYSFHKRLLRGVNTCKDAQATLTRKTYKMNRQQCIVDQPLLYKTGKRPASISSAVRKRTSSFSMRLLQQRNPGWHSERNDVYRDISQCMISCEINSEYGIADYPAMIDTMRALQLMVEGHNLQLQTYLAKQPDNIKSFNIVLDVIDYFHSVVPICHRQSISLIMQVLDTITELAQGCLQNQFTIFNNKVINPVNTILREHYTDCDDSDVLELKCKVVICLLSLLEGGIDNSETIFREMAESLDLVTVKNNMETIYHENLTNLKYEKLESGFLYCILVMTLAPALSHDQMTMFYENNQAFAYFQQNTGKIEVVMDYGQEKQLSSVLFPIPEVCKYLRRQTKERFLWNVKRESPSAKIEDFVRQSGIIIYEIDNQAHVADNKYLSLLTHYSAFWWQAAYGVSVLLNMLILFSTNADGIENRWYHLWQWIHAPLGMLHLVLWCLSTLEFYFIQFPILVNRRHVTPDEEGVWVLTSSHFWASVTESRFWYHIMMVVFSVMGLFYPAFYSLHLLDFAYRDSTLQGVIASITLNVNSMTRTAIFGIIVIYIHSIVGYLFFRDEFDNEKGVSCESLSSCFFTVLSHGVRAGGGVGDILKLDDDHRGTGWRTGFEMSFFLVVVVILLNAIFGIIFDTFGHLRNERDSIQQDMKESCFICSIPAVEFQRRTKKGFEDHVKNDHNIWQYLFFLVHLRNKDQTEYTGPESYVASCLKTKDYGFFPINRALGLDKEIDDDSERLEKLEEMNQLLLEKMEKMELHIDKLVEQQSRSRQNSLMLSPM